MNEDWHFPVYTTGPYHSVAGIKGWETKSLLNRELCYLRVLMLEAA